MIDNLDGTFSSYKDIFEFEIVKPKENEVWWVSYGSSPKLSKVKVIKITDKITITTGDIYHNMSYNQVTHKRGYIEFVEKVEC